MAKKKKELGDSDIAPSTALDKQVLDGDTFTIADAKQFIVDGKRKQEDFKLIADRSWNEIEKRNKLGKLYGGNELDRAKRWTKFPLWWSCWKIRQPITLARLAIPVLKDTQGDDPFGRTACILGERFVKGILKTFEAFSEFSASNDDFLVTNFGWGRWFYRSETVQEEEEKIRLQVIEQQPPPPEMGPDGQPMPDQAPPMQMPPIFLTPDGQEIPQEQVQEDDLGPYFSTGQMVSVDNEEVYFEAGLYPNLIVDPDVTKWNKVTRLAFEYTYNYREFKKKFGQKALDKLTQTDIHDYRSGKKPIIVYEYHDSVLKEVRWFADASEDFFQPSDMEDINYQMLQEQGKPTDGLDNSDLYGLSGFFPCTEPLIINQSTRSFWPTPEFFQVQDILDDISSIVTRMLQLTRAVRIRFLFDSSVKALVPLIGENWAQGEGTGMGVPNLEQSLMNNRGDLSNLVAYFPVDELMKGLQSMYVAFEQRLNMFYNITGFSDLLRGQVSNQASNETYRGLQLEGKFAMNRMEPYQRKVQEWIKDNYQLGMELGLKMFSDQTIDDYIVPQTLDPEDKERYVPALALLKDNRRGRFHIDFETDSTISINQEWKKTQAIETANAITKMMESTAKTAVDMPELADAELRIMKHVIAELTDGKLFVDEITDAIQKTIDKVSQPKPEEPNPEMEKIKIEGGRLQLEMRKQEFEEAKAMTSDRLVQLEMDMKSQLEGAKLAQTDRLAAIETQIQQYQVTVDSQIEQMKIATEAEASRAKLEAEYQKISADISLAQEEISLKRDELMVELRKIADKKEVDQFDQMIEARVVVFEEKLATAQHQLEAQFKKLDEQEKWATEARLQAEHQAQLGNSKIESLEKLLDIALKKKELDTPLERSAGIIKTSEKPKKRVSRVKRDKNGDIETIVHEEG